MSQVTKTLKITLAALSMSTLLSSPVWAEDQAAKETQVEESAGKDAAKAEAKAKADAKKAKAEEEKKLKKEKREAMSAMGKSKGADATEAQVALVTGLAGEGDAAAQFSLGRYLIWQGEAEQGLDLLGQAAEAGNRSAVFELAKEQWSGKNLERDRDAAVATLRDYEAQGVVAAAPVLIGWLPTYDKQQGIEEAQALFDKYTEELGPEKSERIFKALSLKALTSRRGAAATEANIATVTKLAEAGDDKAQYAMAYFQIRNGEEASGVKYLAQSAASGNKDARLAYAGEQWSGRRIDQDRDAAIATMFEFEEKGDRKAIEKLVDWLPKIDKEGGLARANALLDEHEANLPADYVSVSRAGLDLKEDYGFADRTKIAETIARLPEDQQAEAVSKTYGKDQNLYVWLMQNELAERGYYSGERHGLFTRSTINGFEQLCSELGLSSVCAQGPLKSVARKAIAEKLAQ